ncbi:MAG TPA: hypothetical protein VLT92_05775 [Burkholderiales bacterium]|nr:hypothetical protein [Burkholderiales bacterium]
MRVGIISVFTDYHRRGAHHRGVLQPQIGPLIAALLPPDVKIEIVNDTWGDPDWTRGYDLLFLSCLHSDFDRARQISHYWRKRGAKTVLGGNFASTYTGLCRPFFDAIAVGDPESTVPRIYHDFCRGELQPLYISSLFSADRLPTLRLDMAAGQQVLPLAIEASRGCPFTCEFCALTAVGTRYHTRPVADLVRDIVGGRRMLEGIASWLQRRIVIFYDNNLGGNLGHLRNLCDAFATLGIRWGACVTFNVVSNPDIVRCLAAAGCRCVFVGLESFNPSTICEMGKHQNVIARTRSVIDSCRDHGILVMAGLMLSPVSDTLEYISSIPQCLRECGLHVPTYISFETPFPGTPHFKRLVHSDDAPFMPNALLRDFNGYTLVTRPQHAGPEEFVSAFKNCYRTVYSRRARFAKLADDFPRFARHGNIVPIMFDLYELLSENADVDEHRTYIAGTEIAPPEAAGVPLTDGDFSGEEERQMIMAPWAVADGSGRALPHWLDSQQFYLAKGRTSPRMAAIAATAPSPPGAAGGIMEADEMALREDGMYQSGMKA